MKSPPDPCIKFAFSRMKHSPDNCQKSPLPRECTTYSITSDSVAKTITLWPSDFSTSVCADTCQLKPRAFSDISLYGPRKQTFSHLSPPNVERFNFSKLLALMAV